MKVRLAVDIDGTLTRWPKICWELMWAFPDHVLLTGATPEFNQRAKTEEEYVALRRKQLEKFGGILTWNAPIKVCVGANSDEVAMKKAEYCRDHQVMLFIDDTERYCECVRSLSPGTMVLRVMP